MIQQNRKRDRKEQENSTEHVYKEKAFLLCEGEGQAIMKVIRIKIAWWKFSIFGGWYRKFPTWTNMTKYDFIDKI